MIPTTPTITLRLSDPPSASAQGLSTGRSLGKSGPKRGCGRITIPMTQHWIIEVGHSVCRDHNDALMETAGPGPHSTHIVWSPCAALNNRNRIAPSQALAGL